MTTTFSVGSLVKTRGREWVVLPESDGDMLILRPLGGADHEITGIYRPLEFVEPATFDLPDPTRIGDHQSCRLLRDALRLSSRSATGPFQSFARIAIEPRPYQLVPLLLALKLDPVRLLIADDVGVGKTIEAALIARELLDRGEVQRIAVLCPPHLAEQWQVELRDKFHLDAELVLSSTASRLERGLGLDESLFDRHERVIVSMDFIKTERRVLDFVRAAPELVIVDEAHTCATGFEGRGSRHQRHALIKNLAADPKRHMILVTATPHSGNEDSFRSLLGLLAPDFANLPADLTGAENEPQRRKLAAHFVQRRRGDIRHFLKADTPFPERFEAEESYRLSPEYRRLFDRVLKYARETIRDPGGKTHRQRVRWWSALALLRSAASSPAAAAATLRNRAPAADAESIEAADEIGRRTVLDVDVTDVAETSDVVAGADDGGDGEEGNNRRRLLEMAREADALEGDKDAKLIGLVEHLKKLLEEGHSPIVFCRYIPTADYVARELPKRLGRALKDVVVASVTGTLPPSDREARVAELTKAQRRVLVCTDCLSEGINLQEHFDAVVHYDLSWNPTRHEQREGRVDRYGGRPKIRVLTYYGLDNQIDGIVLDVLIRKHEKIRSSLGIAVPVPVDTDAVIEAVMEGILLKEGPAGASQGLLFDRDELMPPQARDLHERWDRAADREKRSRTMFAQETIKVDEVARELEESRAALGASADVRSFTIDSLRALGAAVTEKKDRRLHVDVREVPRALRDGLGNLARFDACFEPPVVEGALLLSRTHPVVEALASHVLECALDGVASAPAARAGAIRTRAVERRTTLLLLRFRHDIATKRGDEVQQQLAEECRVMAFAGPPTDPTWLENAEAEALLGAVPEANINGDQAADFIRKVLDNADALGAALASEAERRAKVLLESHQRVRLAARLKGVSYRVEPRLPADLLGVYVLLPVPAAGGA